MYAGRLRCRIVSTLGFGDMLTPHVFNHQEKMIKNTRLNNTRALLGSHGECKLKLGSFSGFIILSPYSAAMGFDYAS
jgi:hypothetical protein